MRWRQLQKSHCPVTGKAIVVGPGSTRAYPSDNKSNSVFLGRGDILAGIVVALALIREAIGFSIIAGVDPKVGLYASFLIAVIISLVVGLAGMISAASEDAGKARLRLNCHKAIAGPQLIRWQARARFCSGQGQGSQEFANSPRVHAKIANPHPAD